jgi:hypothetical protein
MTDIEIQPPATTQRRFQCRHIFTDGHRCGSPCLRHEDFCYYHHNARGRRALCARSETIDLSQGEHRASPFTLPNPEDRSAIQVAIGEILNRLASNELDPRRAGLLLYGLQIASINLPHSKSATSQPGPVEDTVTHPDLGTVALPVELHLPSDKAPSSLFGHLLQQLRRPASPTSPSRQPPQTR